MNMKLRPNLTQPQIFENGNYEHPWYTFLNKPNPPSKEAVKRAKFRDKTYNWPSDNRSGDKRSKR